MSLPVIRTTRLVLRPFVRADASSVQRLAGDPAVALTTQNIPHPYRDGMAEVWIESLEAAWADARSMTLAVTHATEGLVGAVGLELALAHARGELGYWIGVPFWGRGYATEAAAALVRFGFGDLGLNRIQAHHMMRNPASGRVMLKLGMKPEGVHRQLIRVRQQYEDVASYAMLRTDRAAQG